MRFGRKVFVFGGVACCASVFLTLLWARGSLWTPETENPDPRLFLREARRALIRGEFDKAEQVAERFEPGDVEWVRSRLVAGEAATKAKRYEAAVDYYASIPRDGSPAGVLAAFSMAEVCREVGRLTDAEDAYTYVLAHQPDNAAAHSRLASILGVTGRRWECRPHFMHLIRQGSWAPEALVLLSDLGRPWDHDSYLKRCLENHPEDVLVQLGVATLDFAQGRSEAARERLTEITAAAPHLIAAQAMLGELIVDGDDPLFLKWHAALPPGAEESPEIWYVRGLWVRRHGELRVAARCFWKSLEIDPTHRRATYQLSQVLTALEEESGEVFARRSRQWYDLTESLDSILRSEGEDEQAARQVVKILEDTGRLWEAWAWALEAGQTYNADWAPRAAARIFARLTPETPRMLSSENLVLRYDLSDYPQHAGVFARIEREITGPRTAGTNGAASSSIRFVDEAAERGIDFVYFSSPDPATQGVRMFESDGGGVAVLDYDHDGRPDLFFTQGAPWTHGDPVPTPTQEFYDPLYRNLGGSFVDVASETGVGDLGFGQGCTAGDFNNDGFVDLYVANVGANRLYQNNGDGTFSDVSDQCGLVAEDWTSSCVIVDLNGDGFPDLYDVTYVNGERLYDTICDGEACSPQTFKGTPDRVYVSGGDGTFDYLPQAAQRAPAAESKGLGVVAADIFRDGRLSLFISNDQAPNFFLRSYPDGNAANMRLVNEGFAAGLAFDGEGLSLACMGIAADDANGDGRIDFFVTNFKDESNTLYSQDLDGLFVDTTNAAGLEAPSIPLVGWGTQFLDADLDGEPDLVLTNGHVDDYRHKGGSYRMRPQFFRNTGGGRFVELPAEQIGEYFGKKYLGRGLARLDWNRDGRTDFAVSNILDRPSLVTNHTVGAGNFLNVRLHATSTARDAIGTHVHVTIGDRHFVKQLTAGDGYQAGNERTLQFGLGSAEQVSELEVQWPSGATTTHRDIPANITLELVEGNDIVTLWRETRPEAFTVAEKGRQAK